MTHLVTMGRIDLDRERACNSRTACIEGEMLAVTKFKSCNGIIDVITYVSDF